jgi:mRNA-degrading endonuclease RelE of RelBE toxin-antitoxin system
MKNTKEVYWHETCFENWKKSLDDEEAKILNKLNEIKEERKRLAFYRFQIDEAKRLGKSEFDKLKFKRKKQ